LADTINKIEFGRIISLLICAGFILYATNVVLLSNAAHSDAKIYELGTREMLSEGTIPLKSDFPFSFWVTGIFIVIFGLPKIVPLLLFIFSTILFYKITHILFSKRWKLSFMFWVCNYWILVFSSVNYIEPFIMFYVLAYLFLFLREHNTTNINPINYVGMILVALLGAITKLTGLAFFPLFILFAGILLFKKIDKELRLRFLITIFSIICIALIIFFLLDPPQLSIIFSMYTKILISFNAFLLKEFNQFQYLITAWFAFFRFPPNDCLNELLFGTYLPVVKVSFFVLTIPIVVAVIIGLKKAYRENIVWRVIGLLMLFGFVPLAMDIFTMSNFILPRYTIPILSLFALIVAHGTYSMKKNWRIITTVAIILFSVYSLAYTSYMTYYYFDVDSQFAPGLQYLQSLPKGQIVVGGYSTWLRGVDLENIEMKRYYQADYADYVWVGCYKESIDSDKLSSTTEKVYSDKCNDIYHVRDFNNLISNMTINEQDANIGETKIKQFDACH